MILFAITRLMNYAAALRKYVNEVHKIILIKATHPTASLL